MAQSKFTTTPIPTGLIEKINGLIDDIAGKAELNHTHNYAAVSHEHSADDITSGTLAVANGGTGVTANPSMLTNLGSTSAASVFAASPRPGVTGTLPIANGGTGATTASDACANIGALPTSGGSMSGDIYKATNDSVLYLVGGDASSSARLALCGKQHAHYPGSFCLSAKNDNAEFGLVGGTNGELSWNSQNIVRNINGYGADINGAITVIEAWRDDNGGYGYIRFYTSGQRYVIQWNLFTIPKSLGAYGDFNVVIPISKLIVGGVNTQAFSLISVQMISSNVMRIQKSTDDAEVNYERTGTFWILGVE